MTIQNEQSVISPLVHDIPADTWGDNNVIITSKRRRDVILAQ